MQKRLQNTHFESRLQKRERGKAKKGLQNRAEAAKQILERKRTILIRTTTINHLFPETRLDLPPLQIRPLLNPVMALN